MFVLDEADEMLSRGFKDQIYDIFQLMPPNLQVMSCMDLPLPRSSHPSWSSSPPLVLRAKVHRLTSVQVGIFSATLPPDALEITRKFMNKPVRRRDAVA